MTLRNNFAEPWKVTLVETGTYTQTGGRIKKIHKYIGYEPFMLTYGDGVYDVNLNININELLKSHEKSGAVATMTAIQLGGRFGVLDIDDKGMISKFSEKTRKMVTLSPRIFLNKFTLYRILLFFSSAKCK